MFQERCPKVREGELYTVAKFLQENLMQHIEISQTPSAYKTFSIDSYDDNHIKIIDTSTGRNYSIPRPAITAINPSQKRNNILMLFLDRPLEFYNPCQVILRNLLREGKSRALIEWGEYRNRQQ